MSSCLNTFRSLNESKSHVVKLEISLYGLKTSSQIWHEIFSEQFRNAGFTPLDSAPFSHKAKETIVICYVDIFLLSENYEDTIEQLKKKLEHKFLLSDLRQPKRLLEMEMECQIG